MKVDRILVGKAEEQLQNLPDNCCQACVTSPPYWGLRDYGVDGQIGLEDTPDEFVENLVGVFREVYRVLRPDGTLWLNMGDCYATQKGKGSNTPQTKDRNGKERLYPNNAPHRSNDITGCKPKDLVGIPWMLAFALRADGWYLRQEVIWSKANCMPESVMDRPHRQHEQIFLLSKSARYFYDSQAVRTPYSPASVGRSRYEYMGTSPAGRQPGQSIDRREKERHKRPNNPDGAALRSVWSITIRGYKGVHFATFPLELPRRCILAGTSEKGCCSRCGAPVVRILESKREATRPGTDTKVKGDVSTEGKRDPQRHVTQVRTIGWKPGCKCDRGTKPCVVLDPFMGAGTTAIACGQLGRSYLGVELNPKYAQLAEQRIRKTDFGLGVQF